MGNWFRTGDYPRIRGGTSNGGRITAAPFGLSPHTRGNRPSTASGNRDHRTIPAYAGEPASSHAIWGAPQDYPRIRGGTAIAWYDGARTRGLSPHTRGNHPGEMDTAQPARTIPAYAGEPRCRPAIPAPRGDYPRIRGGTLSRLAEGAGLQGLSPHTRGNPLRPTAETIISGTIPAYAGEPGNRAAGRRRVEDYPRIRGGTEHKGAA
ncbi:Hypothetical protein GbCGDNIH6_1382 [Granulibacter bethesdensis]|nr:Hypothetical protein GbCGDNIH6_1382 [Granulibacter bethesdensis]